MPLFELSVYVRIPPLCAVSEHNQLAALRTVNMNTPILPLSSFEKGKNTLYCAVSFFVQIHVKSSFLNKARLFNIIPTECN